jgi:hypothetical protein
MKFEHDIFISYAPAAGSENNAVSEWSLKFCDYLSVLMNRLFDKKPVIMVHDDLRVRQSMLGENYKQIISGTAVVVVILSPEYIRSVTYMRELEDIFTTLRNHETETGIRHRVFKVIREPVKSEEQPDFLKTELNYNFYEINRFNKKPITYDLSGKNEPDQKFWSKLVDLAYDITDAVSDVCGDKMEEVVVKERPGVFLAETSFDQAENRDMLKRELQHLGFRVLPVQQIPDDAENARLAIETGMQQSVMAVHLLGAWYGDFLKNSKYSFIDFQIKTVKDFLDGRKNQTVTNQLIWIPNDIKPTDQRQALYLKRLKRDEAQYRTEIIETPFEVFKTILNARLHELTNPTVVPAAEKNKLYVIYEKESRNKIADFLHQIRANGFDILESHGENGNFYPLARHINNLLIADAVLIYKGDCPMDWLNSKIRDLVKAPGYGKSKPFRAIEIISKQKTADKSLLFLNNVPVIWDDEVNTEVITHFLDHLAKK